MNQDGWRIFPTEFEAEEYCTLTWAAIIHGAPIGRIPPEYVAFKEALDSALAAAGDLRSVPVDIIEAVSVVPVLGLDYLGAVVPDIGESRAWATPRITAAGEWAVPCLEGFESGGPEPEWPPMPGRPPAR